MDENKSQWNNATVYAILAGITIVGITLRFYRLDFQSLWYDELHSIVPTHPNATISSIIEYCKIDQPPLFFIYLHYFFQLFGYDEIVGRIAVAIIGVLGIPVMYLLGREVRGKEVGLFAALLTALNYMHVYYSQELRFYSMAFLLTSLSFLFFIRASRYRKVFDFICYTLTTAALLYTHYYGLVIYATQTIIFLALLFIVRDKRFLWGGIASGLCAILLFLPWMPVILSDLNIETFWIRMPPPTFLADYFYYYFGKDAFVTLVFLVFTYLYFRFRFYKADMELHLRTADIVIIGWLVLSYLIPYVKSLIGPPMLYVRYTLVSVPAWILIISIGWDRIRHRRWRYGLAGAVCLSMLINIFLVRKHYTKVDKQQFREASHLVMERNSEGLPVYSKFHWHYNFYFRDGDLKVRDVATADLRNVDKFWLLQAEFFSPREKDEVISGLGEGFEVVERFSFFKTEAVLIQRE